MMSNIIFEGNYCEQNDDNEMDADTYTEEVVGGEILEPVDNVDGNIFSDLLSQVAAIARKDNNNAEDEDDDDYYDDEEGEDSDYYHNEAVKYARYGKFNKSAQICIAGLKRFPYDVDLLADVIKYSSDAGNRDVSCKYYAVLKDTVPVQRWNWRAYSFSLEYLLNDPIGNEYECRAIIANYKRYIPYEEKVYVAESELEEALGNADRSMEVLHEALASRENASQCSIRLADMQMDRGLYEDVIATSNCNQQLRHSCFG